MERAPKSIENALSKGSKRWSLRYLTVEATAPSIDETREDRAMTWEKPEFVEIKMDCEINSYQDDFQRDEFNGIED